MTKQGELIGFVVIKNKQGVDMFIGDLAIDPSERDKQYGQYGRKISKLWASDEDCYAITDMHVEKMVGKKVEVHGLTNDFCKNITIDKIKLV